MCFLDSPVVTTYMALYKEVQWPSGLERWTGDRVVLDPNPAVATSLRNFGNFVNPALPGSFGEVKYPTQGVNV